jgi:hypothetical protein
MMSFEELLLTYDKTNGNKADNGSKKFSNLYGILLK